MKKITLPIFIFLLCCATNIFPQNKMVIAVLDFQNNAGNRDFDYLEQAIPEMLITNLMASEKIKLVERTRIQHILEEHKLTLSGVIAENTIIQLGELIGASYLLYGSVFKFEETIRLDARICNTTTGQVLAAEKVEMSGDIDFIKLIDDLSEKIIKALTDESIDFVYPENEPIFEPKQGKAIAITCVLDNRYKLENSTTPSYLLIDLTAGKVVTSQQRIPLNICMVIDKSGSMEAEYKLENVKKAALFVVDNLNSNDYLSIVTYDTQVNTPIPSNLVSQRARLKSVIESITSGSSTNLSGGMLEGYAQVALHFQQGYVNRVLLLTDGLANTGITNPLQLKKIVSEKNRDGFTLSTFGVGSDFNEDLLTTLAEFGGANYYYIDSPDKIAEIFSNELQGLLSVVAQNVTLEISFAPDVKLLDLFGYSFNQDQNIIRVKLNDIFSEERKSILIKFEFPTNRDNEVKIGDVLLTYDDVVLSNRRITEKFTTSITLTEKEDLIRKHKNSTVQENIALFESTKLLDEAMTFIDHREYDKAEESIQKNLSLLQSNINYNSSKRVKQQMLNVVKYSSEYKNIEKLNETEMEMMQKDMKYKNYLQKKKR